MKVEVMCRKFECLYENSLQIPALTSTLTAKKSMKMKFSAEKKYITIFFRESKDYKYVKFPQTLYRHFKLE